MDTIPPMAGPIRFALNGQTIPLSLFGSLALITLGYFVFHMTLAAWLFRKKEF